MKLSFKIIKSIVLLLFKKKLITVSKNYKVLNKRSSDRQKFKEIKIVTIVLLIFEKKKPQ